MRLVRTHVAGVIGIGIIVSGCGDVRDDVTTVQSALSFTTVLPMPLGWNPTEAAVAGFSIVRVNDRVRVKQFGAELPAPVTNMGSIETNIGADANVGTVLSIAPVTLRNRAIVNGSLYTPVAAAKQAGAVIAQYDQENVALPVDGTWTRLVNWPTTVNPGQMLEPGQSPTFVNLVPGAYQFAVAKSGRGFNLTTGEYFFDYMTIEPLAGLAVDASAGPVTVHLKQSFTLRTGMGGTANRPTPGLPIPSFTVVAQGTGVNLLEVGTFNGVLIARNGSISVSAGVTVHGALVANVVEVHQNALVEHVRDQFAFAKFDLASFPRPQVTGGSLRHGTEVTDEFLQSESVAAVSGNGSDFVVAVGYNDKTEPTVAAKVTYPAGRSAVLSGTGTFRVIQKGVSLMGWSYSTDGGRTFNYGGRLAPPAPNWSTLWGDPAMAKASFNDPNVYYAQLAGTTAAFEGTTGYNSTTQTIANQVPRLDGWCIARSTDRGITFPTLSCVQRGSGLGTDATTIAVNLNASGRHDVFLTGLTSSNPHQVWRMDGEAMTFVELPPAPLPGSACISHPRLRVSGGLLYMLCEDGVGQVVGNTLNIGAGTWQTPRIIATGATQTIGLIHIRIANSVSFDIGLNSTGQTKVRVMFMIDDDVGDSGKGLVTYECQPDLTGCAEIPGWSTRGAFGWEGAPSLRSGAGHWVASFMIDDNSGVGFYTATLAALNGTPFLLQTPVSPPVIPCTQGTGYWGDYNEIDTYGATTPLVFVPYTVNGPGCRFSGTFLGDHHVKGAIVLF